MRLAFGGSIDAGKSKSPPLEVCQMLFAYGDISLAMSVEDVPDPMSSTFCFLVSYMRWNAILSIYNIPFL